MKVDDKLLNACKKGDRLAQSALYRQCFHILMGVCTRYVKNEQDAVEQLNEGFLKILRNLGSYKKHVPFEAWIKRIMINTMIDHYRRQKKYREKVQLASDFPEGTLMDDVAVFNEADSRLDAEHIEICIQNLPDVTREVFNLFFIDGYSHKEISVMMRIPVGTSKWHVSQGRRLFKSMIAKFLQTESCYGQEGGT